MLGTLEHGHTGTTIGAGLGAIAEPVTELGDLPLTSTSATGGIDEQWGFPSGGHGADQLTGLEGVIKRCIPTRVGEGGLVVDQLLVDIGHGLGALSLGVDNPGVAVDLVPRTGSAGLAGHHHHGLIRLEGHDVLALGSGLRHGDAELLKFSGVVEVSQRAGVLRQTVGLAVHLHQCERAGSEIVLVLGGLIGDILQKALGEDLRNLGVTDLSQIRRIASLDVGLELLDHVGGIAIELGGLDLNVRVLLVPLGHNVVDQGHAFGIGQTMHIGDVDHTAIAAGLRVAGSVAAAATGQTNTHCCYRSKSSHDALVVRYHISTPA